MRKRYYYIGVIPFLYCCLLYISGCGQSKPPSCVIDVDGTLFNFKRPASPVLGALETIKWIKSREITIVYLSARTTDRREETEWILQKWDFPSGRLILKEDPDEESSLYKTREIRSLQEQYNVLFGVGDKDTDLIAYTACGITDFFVDGDWDAVRVRIEEYLEEIGLD
ncbi:MAG: HAD family acid phosphatase [PVC group bacterium]